MSITVTSPAWALPGEIHSPGLAAWKVAVASARTASPATSPVEASTPLGTSQANTTASPAASLIAPIAARAGSRGSPEKPVPRIASTIAAAAATRAGLERPRARPGQALEVGAGVAAQLLAGSEQQHLDLAAPVAQQPGHDQPVAAVVALADDDDDPALGDPRTDQLGQPGPGALHQLQRRDPAVARSPTRRWRAAARRRAAGSSQSGSRAWLTPVPRSSLSRCGDRDCAGLAAVWVSEIRTSTPSSAARAVAAPCRVTAGGPPGERHLDVAKAPGLEAERLGHRLLGAEAGGQVLAGTGPRRRRRRARRR